MQTLVHDCDVLVTMSSELGEIEGASLLIDDGQIVWTGSGEPPTTPGQVRRVDGRGTVALPGLVNCHHHLYQSLTKARAQQGNIFGWLQELYPIWKYLDRDWTYASAALGLAELLTSGCTLSTDHHYLFPRGSQGLIESTIDAAAKLGIRFQPNRGSMDLGEHNGGLPPAEICQDPDAILADTEDLIKHYHDPNPGAMVRISVGPCYPLTNSDEIMRASAELARQHGLHLHTHIAEGRDEETRIVEQFGLRPLDLLDSRGFLGEDVWLAHCVQLSEADVRLLSETGTGVATCPSSNMRLGSGIAPVRSMLDHHVRVGIGVDGSASNDSGSMIGEARQLLLAHRVGDITRGLAAREVLRTATAGGAATLGRDDLGTLEPGKRADIALFDLNTLEMAGTDNDPVAGLVFAAPRRAKHVFVEGRQVVADGRLTQWREDEIISHAQETSRRIPR